MLVLHPDDDALGMHHVMHCGALGKELRIRGNFDTHRVDQ
ncbi:hypothetical protein SDC9_179119 [bioreactor metagenome]|uniref:Uncharacterized protein n=1 Tax=bioreactor metagenome TaxID=1076179 RepID=A0A645GXV5_9ZZZZ